MNSVTGEFLTLLLMALALGMDSFSVGLGMGMFRLRLKRVVLIAITVGLFHILMPLLGMVSGQFLTVQFGTYATWAGGLPLILLGIGMFISGLNGNGEQTIVAPVGIGLIIFALSVSLDSFSVGLTLGIYGARTLLAVSLFGVVATILTLVGLLLGRKVQGLFGTYGQVLGGSVLLAFGIKLIWPL